MKTRSLFPLCAIALLLAAPVYAQAPYADSATTANEQAPSDGIAVSGTWTITVYDADGTMVRQNTFHNDLSQQGSLLIANILAGATTVGGWTVQIGDLLCIDDNAAPADCIITELGTGNNVFDNLTVTVISSSGGDSSLDLIGSFTAQADGDILQVNTKTGTCPPTVPPGDCILAGTSSSPPFTFRFLDVPLAVEVGQVVQVEVNIGFGTATSAAARTAPVNRASFN